MTIREYTKLTLESFISAPRRSSAVPNENGRLALYTLSTYSLESHSEGKEIRIVDLENGTTTLFSDDSKNKDTQWLGNDLVLWLREAEGGTTEMWSSMAVGEKNAYLIATIDGAASNLKTKRLLNGSFAVTVTGKASLDGSFYNSEKAIKPSSSAREYDTFPVRVWDTYVTPEKNVIWYTVLEKSSEPIKRYKISQTGFINASQGTNLVHPNPDPLYGVDSEVGTSGILFTAKDPSVNPVIMEKSSLYFVPLSTFKEDPAPPPRRISVPGFDGNSSSPTFSPDGKSAAFLQTKDPSNAYANPRIIIIGHIDSLDHMTEVVTSTSSEAWDLRPGSLAFSSDAKELYIIAESRGSNRVFKIPITSHSDKIISAVPTPITTDGAVSSLHALSATRLLFTISTITCPGVFRIIDPSTNSHTCTFSHSHDKPDFGSRPPHVSQINFKGAGDYKVQAFVVKPSDFTEDKTYPMLLAIHGGPVGSWPDAWGYRWNAAVFAEQGYIVIMPNITGSTGFGQEYIEGIVGEWGGRPYKDLVNCFEYVKENMPFVDTERAVAMGGSYGGYMVNWIAGQPLSKRFRALVSHDGIFSFPNLLSSDATSTLPTDFHGPLWSHQSEYDKHDPSRHTGNWTTPMLFIHSDKDYRCPITEGLAAFNVCQGKGVESKFLNFPDENHFVQGRENSLRWHQVVLGWCDRWCGVERGGVGEGVRG